MAESCAPTQIRWPLMLLLNKIWEGGAANSVNYPKNNWEIKLPVDHSVSGRVRGIYNDTLGRGPIPNINLLPFFFFLPSSLQTLTDLHDFSWG